MILIYFEKNGTFWNPVAKFDIIPQNGPRMTQNDPKWPKKDPKWPKITPNGPKLPQMAKKWRPDLRNFSAIFLDSKGGSANCFAFRMYGKILLVPKIPFQLSDLLRFAMGGKRLDFPLFLNYIRSALLKSYLTFSWSLCKYEKGKYQRIFGRSMHLLLPFPLFESLNGFSNFIHFGSLSAWLLWQSSISQITHTDFTKTILNTLIKFTHY